VKSVDGGIARFRGRRFGAGTIPGGAGLVPADDHAIDDQAGDGFLSLGCASGATWAVCGGEKSDANASTVISSDCNLQSRVSQYWTSVPTVVRGYQSQADFIFKYVRKRIKLNVQGTPQSDPYRRTVWGCGLLVRHDARAHLRRRS
jgi:hypothetical protein